VGFVDAPVLGTRQPAEQGQLTVLAAGPTDLRGAVAPVFDAIGAKTVWVGEEPGAAHRLKLVVNAWVFAVVAGTAQSVALAEGLGLDPQLFLDTIAGGALDAPYVQLKGRAMIAGDYPAAFAVDGALKDSGLIGDALRASGADHRLMTAVNALFADAAAAGRNGEDMAAVAEIFRR
jgi:3-hydroxyisobutyrate dehydrogenase